MDQEKRGLDITASDLEKLAMLQYEILSNAITATLHIAYPAASARSLTGVDKDVKISIELKPKDRLEEFTAHIRQHSNGNPTEEQIGYGRIKPKIFYMNNKLNGDNKGRINYEQIYYKLRYILNNIGFKVESIDS